MENKVYIVLTGSTIWGVFATRTAAEKAVSYAKRATSGISYTVLDYVVET